MKSLLRIAFAVSSLFILSACATAPAANSGFLKQSEEAFLKQERYPFQRVWLNEKYPAGYQNYRQIYVAPVNTEYFGRMEWLQRFDAESQDILMKSAETLGTYMQERFQLEIDALEAFTTIRQDELESADKENIAVLELAIIELIPTPAQANRVSEAVGFFVPFTGIAKSLVINDGSIAIEGRVHTASSDEILIEFADREEDQSTPLFDASDFTYYRHARQHIDRWAQQYARLLITPPEESVKDNLLKVKPL